MRERGLKRNGGKTGLRWVTAALTFALLAGQVSLSVYAEELPAADMPAENVAEGEADAVDTNEPEEGEKTPEGEPGTKPEEDEKAPEGGNVSAGDGAGMSVEDSADDTIPEEDEDDSADGGEKPDCICEIRCDGDNVNMDCPVCAADDDQCAGKPAEETPLENGTESILKATEEASLIMEEPRQEIKAEPGFEVGQLYYTVIDKDNHCVAVSSRDKTKVGRELQIPSTVRDTEGTEYTVTEVDGEGFACGESWSLSSDLEKVILPDTITVIREGAFRNCRNLSEVALSANLTDIEEYAFNACTSLKNVVLPDSILRIGKGAFDQCSLMTIHVPDKSIIYGENVFGNGGGELANVNDILLSLETEIPHAMFHNSYGMKEITVPNHITNIGTMAFFCCTEITKVSIPASVKEIKWQAFSTCLSMQELIMEEGLEVIEDGAFGSCSSLKEVVIPDSVTKMGRQAFSGCHSLKTVKLSEGLTSIEDCSFEFCGALPEITIPSGVTRIGERAFDRCGSMEKLQIAVKVTGGNGERSVTPVALYEEEPENVFGEAGASAEKRHIIFLNADGSAELTGKDLNAVITAYKNVDDGDMTDDRWYGWKLPEMVDTGSTGEENPPKGDENSGGSHDDTNSKDSTGGNMENIDGGVSATDLMVTSIDTVVQAGASQPTSAKTEVSPAAAEASTAQNAKEPKTGDATYVEIYATMAMIAGLTWLLLNFMEEGRGMTEREKEVFVAAFIRWAKKGGLFRRCCAMAAIFCILVYYHAVSGRPDSVAGSRAAALH